MNFLGAVPALVAIAVMLVGCNTPPPAPPVMQVQQPAGAVIGLKVGSIAVEDANVSPAEASAEGRNVARMYPVTPVTVARQWADARLQAVGRSGTARFVVEQADVVERQVATTPGFQGMFLNEKEFELAGTLKARLELSLSDGTKYNVTATAHATQGILENDTLNARDRAYLQLLNALAVSFDQAMEAEIRSSLGSLATFQ